MMLYQSQMLQFYTLPHKQKLRNAPDGTSQGTVLAFIKNIHISFRVWQYRTSTFSTVHALSSGTLCIHTRKTSPLHLTQFNLLHITYKLLCSATLATLCCLKRSV